MSLNKELEKIGLSKKDAKVYLACLELGEATIGQISKKSRIKRTTVYDVIDSLKTKGLISTIVKNKKTFFYAENPKKIERNLEEKKKILKDIMPELLSVTNMLDKKPKIKFFEGVEGIRDAYKDTLNYPDREIVSWFPKKVSADISDKFFFNNYIPKRIENKIWMRSIAPDTKEMKQYASLDVKHLRRTRFLPADKLNVEVDINLYSNNKILLTGFDEKIAIIIESKKIYSSLKSIFEIMWEGLE